MNKSKSQKSCLALLFLAICFLFCACGKSEEVIAVENRISDIGEVSIKSLDRIEMAQSLYDSLDGKSQAKVENYADLQAAMDEYNGLVADTVAKLIDSIGDVNESSLNSIVEAETAFAKLSDDQKSKVKNYGILESARSAYSALLIENVETLIEAVKYSGGEPAQQLQSDIEAAQNAYDDLDEPLKPQVSNYDSLISTKESVSLYFITQTQDAINLAIDTDAGTDYETADALYNSLNNEQKERIENYSTFVEKYETYKNKPPIELISYRLGKDIIGDPTLSVKATNVSDRIIKEYNLTAFGYDDDGVPVPLYFGNYAANLTGSYALKVGETTSSNRYWTLYGIYNDIKQMVVIIRDVEFFDGTTWENSQYQTLRDKYEQQLLATDDENILTRE